MDCLVIACDCLVDNSSAPIYSISGDAIRLPVVIKPQAKSNQVLGVINGRLKIAIVATPVDGKANVALITFMSKLLSVKKHDILIASGATNHFKMLYLPIHVLAKLDEIILDNH